MGKKIHMRLPVQNVLLNLKTFDLTKLSRLALNLRSSHLSLPIVLVCVYISPAQQESQCRGAAC